MYSLVRPLFFRLDPEHAHDLTLKLLGWLGKLPPLGALVRKVYCVPEKSVQAFGLTFPNPVGLAAGYDKDGIAWRGLACLGFGHIEIGTVTPRPQAGNPKPRIFRIPGEGALINRMGFPGKGAEIVARQLQGDRPAGLVLGVNLGINKDTRLENAIGDYKLLLHTLSRLGDYLVVNVSSPNTLGLRRLQAKHLLQNLLAALNAERRALTAGARPPVPLLVKISPDLTDNELDDVLDAILGEGMDGVIAANTTTSRRGLSQQCVYREEQGGLSGSPLRELSTKMIRKIHQRSGGKLPIIGAGGVMSAEHARQKLDAGATLVQVYSGLIYKGPGLVKQIVRGI